MTGQIQVDLGQLRDSSQIIKKDTDEGLRPGLAETEPKIHLGVLFGRHSPSGEVVAARQVLTSTLRRHAENSASYVRRAEQISAFLDHMLEKYSNADRLAGASMEVIIQEFDKALPETAESPRPYGVQP